jgi:hypothetical protein
VAGLPLLSTRTAGFRFGVVWAKGLVFGGGVDWGRVDGGWRSLDLPVVHVLAIDY